MADQYSEGEDSSVETPPPPPPSDERFMVDPEEERYHEQLKIFQGMAQFSAENEGGAETMEDDESVEVPPPANYEQMGVSKDGGSRYGMIAGCLLVTISIVLGVGFGTGAFGGRSGDGSGTVPGGVSSPVETLPPDETVPGEDVSTPSSDSREGRLQTYIVSKSPNGDAFLSDPTSSGAQALQWLQDEDPLELDPLDVNSHLRIDQRYALTTIWFNSPNDWFNQTNWLNEDECTWLGVTCEEVGNETLINRNLQEGSSIVIRVELEGNNLGGNIPADISLLQDMTILNLASNLINGPIPPSIADLNQMTTLVLADNSLSGDLAAIDFSKFSALKIFDVSSNELGGTLPDSMSSMPLIEVIVMDNNSISGSIPGSISNLQTLRKCLSIKYCIEFSSFTSNCCFGSFFRTIDGLKQLIGRKHSF